MLVLTARVVIPAAKRCLMKLPADTICLVVYATLDSLEMDESLLCQPSAMRPWMQPEIRVTQHNSPVARTFMLSVTNSDFL